MLTLLFGLLLSSVQVSALVVVKHQYPRKIELKIVRAEEDSFSTFVLTNHNSREMVLVCKGNRVYDDNPQAMIEYRNYYNEIAGNFILEDNDVCLDIGRFIETSHFGIDESRPFLITLNTKTMKVDKIVYPKIDQFADEGTMQDLFSKPRVIMTMQPKVKNKKFKKIELY